MFIGSTFLVITSTTFNDPEEITTLINSLQENHATVITKEEFNNDTNYLLTSRISHIISDLIQFIEYSNARTLMIPITTPQWVYDCLKAERNLNPKSYNPDPKFFLKDCFVCVADNLPVGDKEAIYGGVRAFGGSYLDVLTKYTTHLISIDLTNEKSVIASSAINNELDENIDIKIVLPHWIDNCLTVGRKLDEEPYLLPNPSILQNNEISPPDISLLTNQEDLSTQTANFTADFLQGKTFYIAPDYNLSERLTASLQKMIERNGGKVVSKFELSSIDIYIGKYRSGDAYKNSCTSNRIIVGNLHWLYSIIVLNKWKLPVNSNILHYPSPNQPLNAFKDLNISVTNYSGDARTYLSKLITILGGKFTKTLTKENHYLLAAKPEGKKYDTAARKWVDSKGKPTIHIVNHLWLEECFAKWELLNHDQKKYKFLGNGKKGVEMLLGRTKLVENDLKRWYGLEKTSESKDIDDSMSEDESTQPKQQPIITEKAKPKVDDALPQRRNAAKKAAAKLHDNMSDLNNYQEIAKSSRKMKTYMEGLDGQAKKTVEEPALKKTKQNPEIETIPKPQKEAHSIIAIITGCESEIVLSKKDAAKLSTIGIKVLSDFSFKYKYNTLIAPKILRTEKFLRCLHSVDKIIHPNYLVDILKKINQGEITPEALFLEYNILDYSLDKVLPLKELNAELGSSGKGNALQALLHSSSKGKVFEGINLNLSSSLNGGVDVIALILSDHGMTEHEVIKAGSTSTSLGKHVLASKLKGKDITIFVCHKTKDTKLINVLKKKVKEDGTNAVVVEWDWCVRCIFKMTLQPFEEFKL